MENLTECAYCGALLDEEGEVPAVDDDEAWAALALEHADGCDWVETRAHRLEPETCYRVYVAGHPTEHLVWSDSQESALEEAERRYGETYDRGEIGVGQ